MLTNVKVLLNFSSVELSDKVSDILVSEFPEVVFKITDSADTLYKLLRYESFSLILTDFVFYGYTVFDLLDFVNIIKINTPIIIISDHCDNLNIIRSMRYGASDFLFTSDLFRLPPAIERELKLSKERINLARAEMERSRLLEILDLSRDQIYIFDADTYNFLYVNSAVLAKTGYLFNEILKLTPVELLDGFDKENVDKLLLPLIERTNEKLIFNTDLKTYSGETYPAEISVQLIERFTDKVFLATVVDQTENILKENQIRRLRQAFDQNQSAIVISSIDGKLEYANKRFYDLTGYNIESVSDMNFLNFISAYNNGFLTTWSNVSQGLPWTGEIKLNYKTDNSIDTLTTVSPIFNLKNQITHIVTVLEDITERKNIEHQLFHAQKMEAVGELASSIAHDFGNLLTAIGGFANFVLKKTPDEDNNKQYLYKIVDLTAKAKDLTKNLLSFVRKTESKKSILDLNEIVIYTKSLSDAFIGDSIVVDLQLTDTELSINADDSQLTQVILNLLTNARDAMNNAGNIFLTTDIIQLQDDLYLPYATVPASTYALLIVEDTGSGIDEKTLKNIFDPFFTTKESGKGTGLGLSIVTQIMAGHGGFVNCTSVIGKGTTFELYFPINKSLADTNAQLTIDQSMKYILLADDDTYVCESISKILTHHGYNVLTAYDGNQILDLLEKYHESVSVVLADMIMPNLNGLEAYKLFHVKYPHIKTIFITGNNKDILRQFGISPEEVEIILKPITVDIILNKLKQLIN